MAKRKHRFFNTYLTATISVALVLLLVGLECVVALSARQLMNQVKETTVMTLVLSDETESADSLRVTRLLTAAPFCKSYTYISKEQALEDHKANMGEDPTEFLGYNPIRAAFEVQLKSEYVQEDSIKAAEKLLGEYPFVEEITYPHVVIDFFNQNIGKISWILLIVAAILLVISIVLVVNTIRLVVYSRRFLIKTMQLVGATPWMIKGPIVRKSVWMGLIASVLSMIMVAGAVYYVFYSFGFWLFELTWQNIVFVACTTMVAGLMLTFFASVFAVNKYIRLRTNDLYYV